MLDNSKVSRQLGCYEENYDLYSDCILSYLHCHLLPWGLLARRCTAYLMSKSTSKMSVKNAQGTFVQQDKSSDSVSSSSISLYQSSIFTNPKSRGLSLSISSSNSSGSPFRTLSIPLGTNQQMNPFALPSGISNSFIDLYTERTYLLSTLQAHNCQATEILRKIPPLEEKLRGDRDPPLPQAIRRRVRKQIDWFTHRLDETTRQEQTILARLEQVNYEIQSRERLAMLEQERWRMWGGSGYGQNYLQPHTQLPFLGPWTPDYFNCGYQNLQPLWLFPLPMPPGYFSSNGPPPLDTQMPQQHAQPQHTELSPLSPSFLPSGIFTPSSPFMTTPFQDWPLPGTIQPQPHPQHWPLPPQHQLPTPFLSPAAEIGTSIERPKSARGPSPKTRGNPASNQIPTPISFTTSTDNNTDADIEARDTVHSAIPPLPTHQLPHSRKNSSTAPFARPVSLPADHLFQIESGGINSMSGEQGAGIDSGPKSTQKRHSLPNLSPGARRRSLPALFGLSNIWAPTSEDEIENKDKDVEMVKVNVEVPRDEVANGMTEESEESEKDEGQEGHDMAEEGSA